MTVNLSAMIGRDLYPARKPATRLDKLRAAVEAVEKARQAALALVDRRASVWDEHCRLGIDGLDSARARLTAELSAEELRRANR